MIVQHWLSDGTTQALWGLGAIGPVINLDASHGSQRKPNNTTSTSTNSISSKALNIIGFSSDATLTPYVRACTPSSGQTRQGWRTVRRDSTMSRVLFITKISADDTMHKHLARRFRSEHPDLILTDTRSRPAAEFLDQCAIVFQCTACGTLFHFGDSESHRTGCPRSSPGLWSFESSAPANHKIVALVLRLLEVLGLPQDITLDSATETLKDVQFLCLCGDPRYTGHFDFQKLVGIPNIAMISAAEIVLRSLNTSSPRTKNTKRLNQRSSEGHEAAQHRMAQLSRALSSSMTTTRTRWHLK